MIFWRCPVRSNPSSTLLMRSWGVATWWQVWKKNYNKICMELIPPKPLPWTMKRKPERQRAHLQFLAILEYVGSCKRPRKSQVQSRREFWSCRKDRVRRSRVCISAEAFWRCRKIDPDWSVVRDLEVEIIETKHPSRDGCTRDLPGEGKSLPWKWIVLEAADTEQRIRLPFATDIS